MALEQALLELQCLTERLRRDCPWDREQTARTIVPHTVEEAYEVADAALAGRVLAETDPLRRLRGAAHWLRVLYSAGFDVVLIFEAATDESPETRALLRSKLAGRNEVMDAIIASLEGHLAVPVPRAQAMYRALAAPGDLLIVFAGLHRDEALEEAIAAARALGCGTAVFASGEVLLRGEEPDFLFTVATDSPARLMEGALLFGHLLCELVETQLFGT